MSIYSTKDAYELYTYYLALKQHFSSKSYDFFKYNGKVRSNPNSFETRNDKYHFYKLSKRSEARDLILSNMLHNPKTWIGDIATTDKCESIYLDWLKRKQSLSYLFREDLSELDEDFNANIVVADGQHPPLLKAFTRKKVHIETIIIIDDLVQCFKYWDKTVKDNIVYPDINMLCQKYKPFMSYEKAKMKKILLDKFE